MNTPALTHIIYASSAAAGFEDADLVPILEAARIKNARLAVTGMLLYTEGSFFQVLEGEASVLDDLLQTITADPRHTNVTKIIEEPIAQRDFESWTMGYSEVSISDLNLIDGFGDFFRDGDTFNDLPAGRAKKLLAAFAGGRWRLNGS